MKVDINVPKNSVILDFFNPEQLKQKNDGNFQTECPCCGLQGGRTEGFIIYPETNTWYCHSSRKHGGILELIAMKHKIIRCMDCNDTGEKRRVLEGAMFKETMDVLQAEYSDEIYKKVLSAKGLKQRIQLPNDGSLISDFADKLAKRVKIEDIFFYRPEEKKIVEIGKTKYANGKYEYKGFIPVEPGRFVTIMERYFTPWKNVYTKWGVDEKVTSMSTSVASIVMMSDNFRDQMPIINRIFTVPMPIIYEGKLTFPERGYDSRFHSWMDYNAPKIIKPDMTIEEAKNILQFIYREFPYQHKQDFTNAIARIITPFCRGLYARFTCRTPLFVTKANRERAGKDYHEGVTSILYEGVAGEEPPISNNEHGAGNNNEELRKKIMSALIAGRKKIHFSNNKGFINNAVFEGIITSEFHSDRILGSNTTLSFPNELEFSLSGNTGITMSADLLNRSRTINLFLDIEDANSRKFENQDLHGWVMNNRDLILSAIYALVKNWVEKDMKSGSIPFASFPEWARVVGGIMEAAGYDSPCVANHDLSGVAIDSETSDMKQLFELCYEAKPETWMKKNEIKDIIMQGDDNIFQYIDWDKKSDQTKFGVKLNKFVGRILSDIKMIVLDKEVRSCRWEYKFSKEKSNFDKTSVFENDSKGLKDLNFDTLSSNNTNGNVGNLGNLHHAVQNSLYKENITLGETLPTLPRLPKSIELPTSAEIEASNIGKHDLSRSTNNSDVVKNKQKSDRETQFYESEETADIREMSNNSLEVEKSILEWLKNKQKATIEQLFNEFGIISISIKNKLVKRSVIKQDGETICLN